MARHRKKKRVSKAGVKRARIRFAKAREELGQLAFDSPACEKASCCARLLDRCQEVRDEVTAYVAAMGPGDQCQQERQLLELAESEERRFSNVLMTASANYAESEMAVMDRQMELAECESGTGVG